MTVETRTTVSLADITAIQYECVDCRAKVIRILDDKHKAAAGCGNCNKSWFADGSPEHRDLETFINILRNFPRSSVNRHVSISFEVRGIEKEKAEV